MRIGYHLRFLFTFLLLPFLSQAQNPIEEIVSQINFGDDSIKSVFRYVAENISYDTKFIDSAPAYHSHEEVIKDVLNDRKGVCMHYAALFHAICKYLGYESYIISGYTKIYKQPVGKVPHAWNAIKSDGKWYMYDVTWASGYVVGEKFYPYYEEQWYKKSPEEFIYSHIAFDPIWQFRNDAPTHDQLMKGQYYGNVLQGIDFEVLISEHDALSEIDQLIKSRERILYAGIANDLIQRKIDYLDEQIGIHEHNKKVSIYNAGLKELKTSIDQFEEYKKGRGKFVKQRSSEEAAAFLLAMNEKIEKTTSIFTSIQGLNPELNHAVKRNLLTLGQMRNLLVKEQEFIARYYKSWKPFRFLVAL